MNREPSTVNREPVNCKSWTVNRQMQIVNHEPSTTNREPWTVNCEPWTVNPEPWTVNCESWTVNHEPWTMNCESWTVNRKRLIFNRELWTVNRELRIVNREPWTNLTVVKQYTNPEFPLRLHEWRHQHGVVKNYCPAGDVILDIFKSLLSAGAVACTCSKTTDMYIIRIVYLSIVYCTCTWQRQWKCNKLKMSISSLRVCCSATFQLSSNLCR